MLYAVIQIRLERRPALVLTEVMPELADALITNPEKIPGFLNDLQKLSRAITVESLVMILQTKPLTEVQRLAASEVN